MGYHRSFRSRLTRCKCRLLSGLLRGYSNVLVQLSLHHDLPLVLNTSCTFLLLILILFLAARQREPCAVRKLPFGGVGGGGVYSEPCAPTITNKVGPTLEKRSSLARTALCDDLLEGLEEEEEEEAEEDEFTIMIARTVLCEDSLNGALMGCRNSLGI